MKYYTSLSVNGKKFIERLNTKEDGFQVKVRIQPACIKQFCKNT